MTGHVEADPNAVFDCTLFLPLLGAKRTWHGSALIDMNAQSGDGHCVAKRVRSNRDVLAIAFDWAGGPTIPKQRGNFDTRDQPEL